MSQAASAAADTALVGPEGWCGPMVEAHQHFWEPQHGRNPWLAPSSRIPFR